MTSTEGTDAPTAFHRARRCRQLRYVPGTGRNNEATAVLFCPEQCSSSPALVRRPPLLPPAVATPAGKGLSSPNLLLLSAPVPNELCQGGGRPSESEENTPGLTAVQRLGCTQGLPSEQPARSRRAALPPPRGAAGSCARKGRPIHAGGRPARPHLLPGTSCRRGRGTWRSHLPAAADPRGGAAALGEEEEEETWRRPRAGAAAAGAPQVRAAGGRGGGERRGTAAAGAPAHPAGCGGPWREEEQRGPAAAAASSRNRCGAALRCPRPQRAGRWGAFLPPRGCRPPAANRRPQSRPAAGRPEGRPRAGALRPGRSGRQGCAGGGGPPGPRPAVRARAPPAPRRCVGRCAPSCPGHRLLFRNPSLLAAGGRLHRDGANAVRPSRAAEAWPGPARPAGRRSGERPAGCGAGARACGTAGFEGD